MRSSIRIGLAIFSAWVGWASAQADVRVALMHALGGGWSDDTAALQTASR